MLSFVDNSLLTVISRFLQRPQKRILFETHHLTKPDVVYCLNPDADN